MLYENIKTETVSKFFYRGGSFWFGCFTPHEIVGLVEAGFRPKEGMARVVDKMKILAARAEAEKSDPKVDPRKKVFDESASWWFYFIPPADFEMPIQRGYFHN